MAWSLCIGGDIRSRRLYRARWLLDRWRFAYTLEFMHLGRVNMYDLEIHAEHGNTVIEIAGDEIVLTGIHPHQLGAHDFIFHA